MKRTDLLKVPAVVMAALFISTTLALASAIVIELPVTCFEGEDAKKFMADKSHSISGQGVSSDLVVTQLVTRENGDFAVVAITTKGRVCFLSGGHNWDNEAFVKGSKS